MAYIPTTCIMAIAQNSGLFDSENHRVLAIKTLIVLVFTGIGFGIRYSRCVRGYISIDMQIAYALGFAILLTVGGVIVGLLLYAFYFLFT